MLTADFIYNPTAGRFPSAMLAERAANVFRQQGWEIRLEQTQDGDHLTRLARRAAEEGRAVALVAGGDGSVNLAVAGLIGSDTALGVLPAGTFNVWAQELGLPGLSWTRWMALEESARLLVAGQSRRVDVGVCNGRPFLLWAGVGLDAFVVHRLEPRDRWQKHAGALYAAASTVWNAAIWHGMNLSVEADGHEISGHFLVAVISNIHLYAGGLAEISPWALLDDGVMDLWLFKGETMADTVARAIDLLAGTHLESDAVLPIPFQRLVLRSDAPMYLQVDGEPMEFTGEAAIEIKPLALKILVPQKTRHTLFKYPTQEFLFQGEDLT